MGNLLTDKKLGPGLKLGYSGRATWVLLAVGVGDALMFSMLFTKLVDLIWEHYCKVLWPWVAYFCAPH